MKILFWSDTHLGLTIAGYDATEDAVRAGQVIVGAAEDADLVVFGGDLFNDARPKPYVVATAIDLLTPIYKPFIILPGNHDAGQGNILVETEEGELTLQPAPDALEPIRRLPWTQEYICIPEQPCIQEFGDHRFLLAGHISDAMAKSIAGCSAQDLIDHVFEEALRVGVSAVFSHLDVEGVTPGTEMNIRRGNRLVMPWDIAKRLPCPIINGHIHTRQKKAPNLFQPGSVIATDFGDVDGKKGYMVLEV